MTGTSCKFCGAEALTPTSKYDMPTWRCGTHSVFGRLKRSKDCRLQALQQIVNELVQLMIECKVTEAMSDDIRKRIKDEVDDTPSS